MAWRKPPLVQEDDEPVIHLCWNDCVAFCDWLSKKEKNENVEYCLPTEAEWEYACRAGTTTRWSFGGISDFASEGNKHAIWSDGGQKFDRPQRVAQRQPNAFGLYDMHGNMWRNGETDDLAGQQSYRPKELTGTWASLSTVAGQRLAAVLSRYERSL